jgi:hypothetical protein
MYFTCGQRYRSRRWVLPGLAVIRHQFWIVASVNSLNSPAVSYRAWVYSFTLCIRTFFSFFLVWLAAALINTGRLLIYHITNEAMVTLVGSRNMQCCTVVIDCGVRICEFQCLTLITPRTEGFTTILKPKANKASAICLLKRITVKFCEILDNIRHLRKLRTTCLLKYKKSYSDDGKDVVHERRKPLSLFSYCHKDSNQIVAGAVDVEKT